MLNPIRTAPIKTTLTLWLALLLAGPVLADPAAEVAALAARETAPAVTESDLRLHVETLASDAFSGRLTGTEGGWLAETYTAAVFERIGLAPAGEDGDWFQPYTFTAGVSLGEGNRLAIAADEGDGPTIDLTLDEDWRPLAFSKTGPTGPREVVFAGYGIVAPATDNLPAYDTYVHLDVEDKWVLVFRYLPEDAPAATRRHLARYSSLRYKAMVARDRGAAGLLLASGPRAPSEEELVTLGFDVSVGSTSIAAVSVTNRVAEAFLSAADRHLDALQAELDEGQAVAGFTIPDIRLDGEIDLVLERREGRNVLGRIPGADPDLPAVVVGAHLDHLGVTDDGEVYYGADDNASGVAALIEIAEALVEARAEETFAPVRDVLFGAWTGEELGLLGSEHFTKTVADKIGEDTISKRVAVNLNMDMVGRFDERLLLYGTGSSSIWDDLLAETNEAFGLPLDLQEDSYLPTDATAFYKRGVPVLSAFTGVHDDYHTPGDTADKINFEGLESVARFMKAVTRTLAERDEAPDYQAQEGPRDTAGRMAIRIYLGTIPDYTESPVPGLRLSGVAAKGPADRAGLRPGDIITELAGQTVENVYDYTYVINGLRAGEAVSVTVLRGDEELNLELTPESRN